jgi:hypothetical protein
MESPTQGYFLQQFKQCFSSQEQKYVDTLIKEFYLQDLIDTIQTELTTLDANPNALLKDFDFMSKLYTKISKLRHGIPLYENIKTEDKSKRITSYIPKRLDNNFPISDALKKLEYLLNYFFTCTEKNILFEQARATYMDKK